MAVTTLAADAALALRSASSARRRASAACARSVWRMVPRPSAAAASTSRNCSGAAAAGSSPVRSADEIAAFGNLSKSIHRGFKFDRMFPSDDLDPESIQKLDQLAMMSMKTQECPRHLMEKIVKLLREFGQKHDLERYGRYMVRKVRSRTSTETPRMLASHFLPEEDNEDNGPLAKLRRNPALKDLWDHMGDISMDESTLKRLAYASAEEGQHKLYQMFWSPEGALTYLAHRYPATWASNYRVLYELARRAPDFRPTSVMDYGAGPAPGLAAANEIWPGSFTRVAAVDPSEHMAQLGKFLTADLDLPPILWQRCLYDATEKYDLIIASYVQMEVRGQPSRDALVKQLWARLSPGGALVMLEPGTPTGFRFMHHTREMFITRIGIDHFHFVAPCPHENMCPLAVTGRDWCHFAQRVRRTPSNIYNKGARQRFLEEEKFSFLVIRKCAGPRRKYSCAKDAPTLVEKSYFWPRVLFPAIKAGKHTLLDVCSAPQNFERISTTKAKTHSFGYRYSRKAMWGDLFRYPKRVARPEARLYIPEEARAHLDRLAKKAWKALKWETDEPGFNEEKERDKQFYGH